LIPHDRAFQIESGFSFDSSAAHTTSSTRSFRHDAGGAGAADGGAFVASRPSRSDSFVQFLETFRMFDSDELQRTQAPAPRPQHLERASPMLRLQRAFKGEGGGRAAVDSCSSGDPLDATRLQFCETLLDRYGSAIHVLHFLMRRGRMSDAVAYWREKGLNGEQFVLGLVEPAREAGASNDLASAISSVAKPTRDIIGEDSFVLKTPGEYDENLLRAALMGCRHLRKKRALGPLYTLQMAIGDDLRGGISKLAFFRNEDKQSASKETRETWLGEAILAIERGLPLLRRLRSKLDRDVFGYLFRITSSTHSIWCSTL